MSKTADDIGPQRDKRGAGLYGAALEYGLHCLTWLVGRERPASSRDLAALQGAPTAMVAKIMTKLEKAGLVVASDGVRGGYGLARSPDTISVLQVADAIDGRRPLFECREIRRSCALFEADPPDWATRKVCGIHAVMLRAQKTMRDEMAKTSLLQIVQGVPAPPEFGVEVGRWLDDRIEVREQARVAGIKRREPVR
ncbi:MAG: Rrf2 family transcriptional regulator [Caulobacter sp.]|nr:Rrf2 family transcriptional regulator [Caulobacter sp.]